MPGMDTGLSTDNPAIVSAFQAALLHQGLVAVLILALVAVAWNILRSVQLRRAAAGTSSPLAALPVMAPEPVARRLLRVSFGLIWVFDGVLQGQASMPLGMVPQVVQPAAAASPAWVQHLVNAGTTIWAYHPVSAAAAAVWVQVGIGTWLLVAPRGDWSRLGGVAERGLGAHRLGLRRVVRGDLRARPQLAVRRPRCCALLLLGRGAGRPARAGMGRAQVGKARPAGHGPVPRGHGPSASLARARVLAGPGRAERDPGLAHLDGPADVPDPQPGLVSSWVAAFGRFDATHGWAVNMFCVVALVAIGAVLITGQRRPARAAVAAAAVLCLANWALVQDLGFMGGVGTDPNSMVPMALVLVAGYLALTRAPVVKTASPTRAATSCRSPPRWLTPLGGAAPWLTRRTFSAR